jgi:hypothetical protein
MANINFKALLLILCFFEQSTFFTVENVYTCRVVVKQTIIIYNVITRVCYVVIIFTELLVCSVSQVVYIDG